MCETRRSQWADDSVDCSCIKPVSTEQIRAVIKFLPILEKATVNSKKLRKRNASAVAKGAAYTALAGRPSKQAVTAVFGKTGYALSWVARADRLGVTAEELCERFQDRPYESQEVVG